MYKRGWWSFAKLEKPFVYGDQFREMRQHLCDSVVSSDLMVWRLTLIPLLSDPPPSADLEGFRVEKMGRTSESGKNISFIPMTCLSGTKKVSGISSRDSLRPMEKLTKTSCQGLFHDQLIVVANVRSFADMTLQSILIFSNWLTKKHQKKPIAERQKWTKDSGPQGFSFWPMGTCAIGTKIHDLTKSAKADASKSQQEVLWPLLWAPQGAEKVLLPRPAANTPWFTWVWKEKTTFSRKPPAKTRSWTSSGRTPPSNSANLRPFGGWSSLKILKGSWETEVQTGEEANSQKECLVDAKEAWFVATTFWFQNTP